MNVHAYRFTADDETAITQRVTDTLREWASHWKRAHGAEPLRLFAHDWDALHRLAGFAIGCGAYDLRDCEQEWIAATVRHCAVAAGVQGVAQ